jgi:FkbM family methyltransferase
MKFDICVKFCTILFFTSTLAWGADNFIKVNKHNVLYTFVPFDKPTDHFVKNVFENWEKETFEVFDQVKDSSGVAIDLGSWIGTTAIWLAKNFSHVIAVDADPISLKCLHMNLNASDCANVTICSRPISDKSKDVVFGPRGAVLNESISYIKNQSDQPDDYVVRSITFKQLIHDYVFKNPMLDGKKIALIKCDIEGGEENIIEDVLYFAYYNNAKVYLSFHLDWWKTKKLADYAYLFKYFKTNCPTSNIVEYLAGNPFASILFEPLTDAGVLIKKNMPAVIIGYNQYTYIKNMVQQLEKYTTDIIVVDNNSSYAPLLNYYNDEFHYTVLKQETNYGHKVYFKDFIQSLVGDVYVLTDPDLQFNANLPQHFLETLVDISNHFGAEKVGFALCIDAPDIRTDLFYRGISLQNWEGQFWKTKLDYPVDSHLELYSAEIDTTFCVVNKAFKEAKKWIRVAGDYTCLHLPWHKNFDAILDPGEFEAYLSNNISTSWFRA